MNILEKLKYLESKRQELDDEYSAAVEHFAEYIKDKSIPLMERWNVFVQAPEKLKYHESFIPDGGEGLSLLTDTLFEDSDRYRRGNDVDVAEMLDNYIDGYKLVPSDTLTEELLIEAMEEILEQNLGSFSFDW